MFDFVRWVLFSHSVFQGALTSGKKNAKVVDMQTETTTEIDKDKVPQQKKPAVAAAASDAAVSPTPSQRMVLVLLRPHVDCVGRRQIPQNHGIGLWQVTGLNNMTGAALHHLRFGLHSRPAKLYATTN